MTIFTVLFMLLIAGPVGYAGNLSYQSFKQRKVFLGWVGIALIAFAVVLVFVMNEGTKPGGFFVKFRAAQQQIGNTK